MKKIHLAGLAGLITITSVMALSAPSQELPKQKIVISVPTEKMLVDTVPVKSGKNKKSDTSGYPQKDTSKIRKSSRLKVLEEVC